MSYTGDFVVPFDMLDKNHDGVLSRDEVASGAQNFGMTAAESMALFGALFYALRRLYKPRVQALAIALRLHTHRMPNPPN